MDGLDSSDGVRAVPGVAADLGPGTVGRASGLRCESRLKLWIVLVAGRRRENIFWFRNDNEVFLNVLKETLEIWNFIWNSFVSHRRRGSGRLQFGR